MNRREFLKVSAIFPLLLTRADQIIRGLDRVGSIQEYPNVVILIFDALSAKHMSLYNYPRNTTPNIDRFAENAIVYHNHYASGNFTTSSTASLFSGTYPWFHRALHLQGNILKNHVEKNIFNLIPEDVQKTVYTHNQLAFTLLSQLSAFIDHLKPPRDLALYDPQYSDRIFPSDYYVASVSEKAIMLGEDKLNPTSLLGALDYIFRLFINKKKIITDIGSTFPRGIPQFGNMLYILEDFTDWVMDEIFELPYPYLMYLHALPPHGPYKTRRDFKGIFEDDYEHVAKPEHFFSQGHGNVYLNQMRREYDEFLAYADTEFGRLFDHLEKIGVFENSYVIITSDHGEMFERGIRGHMSETLYESLIRVPLIVSKPGQNKRIDVHTPTSNIDLLPTLMNLYHQPVPEWCEGAVLPEFNNEPERADREIYSVEAKSNPKTGKLRKATIALVKAGYKLICYSGYEGLEEQFEFYNLEEDPEELDDIYSTTNIIAQELKHIMETKLSQVDDGFD